MQYGENLNRSGAMNEIDGVRKTTQQHTSRLPVLHLVDNRVGDGSIDRGVQLQNELNTQAGLLAFIPRCSLVGIGYRLRLNMDAAQELRNFASI